MTNCGYDDDKRHWKASEILDMPEIIGSMKDLTVAQASKVIEALAEEEKELKATNG